MVKARSRRTRALLDNAQIATVDGPLVTLSAPSALARMISDDSNTSLLRDALTQIVGGTWKVEVTSGELPVAAGNPSPPAATRPTPTTPEPPDPRDDTDDAPPAARRETVDPESEAIKLLADRLGARPVE